MIVIRNLKQTGTVVSPAGEALELPEEFLDVLPETCECGADLVINETLTAVSCPNNHCPTKVAQRLADMLAALGVKGMGASKCRDFYRCVGVYTPYAIFAVNPETHYKQFKDYFSQDFLRNICGQVQERRTFTLAEFVKYGFFPGIQDSAFAIFKDYHSMSDFYADLDAKGTVLIAQLLSLTPEHKTVMDTYATLVTFRSDLLQGERFVNIRQAMNTITICISTAVGAPFTSKAEFVAHMNNKYADKVHLNYKSSCTKDCDYLILADKSATTNKAKNARKFGIPIMSGQEFENYVSSL